MSVTAGAVETGPQALLVWVFNVDALGPRLAALEARTHRLPEEEIVRAAALSDSLMRQRWVATRTALRLALEARMGQSLARQPFRVTPEGRPFLPQPAPFFSLSHAGPFALVGLSGNGPIGVDIEEIAPRKISGQRTAQMQSYAVHIAGAPLPPGCEEARFIQAWTRIEAYAKADGRGVGRVLSEAGILGRGSRAARLQSGARDFAPPQFRACDLDVSALAPGFAAAAAFGDDAATQRPKVCDGADLIADFD